MCFERWSAKIWRMSRKLHPALVSIALGSQWRPLSPHGFSSMTLAVVTIDSVHNSCGRQWSGSGVKWCVIATKLGHFLLPRLNCLNGACEGLFHLLLIKAICLFLGDSSWTSLGSLWLSLLNRHQMRGWVGWNHKTGSDVRDQPKCAC